MSPADVMTAAADKLETLLADVPRGPWHVETGARAYPQSILNDAAVLIAETYTGPEVGPAEAEYIAAMSPVVGRALVALLRDRAGQSRGVAKRLGGNGNPAGVYDHELALARAILGEAAS